MLQFMLAMFTIFYVEIFCLKHSAVRSATIQREANLSPKDADHLCFYLSASLKLKHGTWQFGTIEVWKVTSLKLT